MRPLRADDNLARLGNAQGGVDSSSRMARPISAMLPRDSENDSTVAPTSMVSTPSFSSKPSDTPCSGSG